MKRGVMVLDDDLAFGRLMSEYLKGQGFEVWAVDNPEDALQTFRRRKPRAVVLDFNMPVVNGDKFLPLLQEIEPLVRVIVVSGMTGEDVEEKFRGLGYYAFFEKGALSLETLKETVNEIYLG